RPRLQPLLDHVGTAALRALLLHRLTPGDKGAVGIAIAAVEGLAALGPPLDNLAFRTIGAFHPDRFLLHVFAGRVVAAGGEFTEAAILHDHLVAALGAGFVERDIGLLL